MKSIVFAALIAIAASPALSADIGKKFRDCSDCPEMMPLPTGTFTMGSTKEETDKAELPDEQGARERTAHKVTISKKIAMGVYEVTVDEFKAFADATKRPPTDNCITWDAPKSAWQAVPDATWKNPGYTQTGRHPAGCMTLADAEAYVAWLSQKTGKTYRLPTEAEWEFAARAGTTTMETWADNLDNICKYANVADLSRVEAHKLERTPTRFFDCNDGQIFAAPVGSYPASPWGMYDMVGNVWEWVQDCFIPGYDGAPTDGSARLGTCDRRIVRSGGWYARNWFVRPAARSREEPTYRSSTLGLRVVREM